MRKLLGIPTRSDAVQVSQDYAQAVKRQMLEEKIERFHYILSSVLPHNHVVEAFRDAGRYKVFAKYGEVAKIPVRAVSRKTDRLLKPQMILDHYLDNVRELRAILLETREILDYQAEVTANVDLGDELRPYLDCDIRSINNGQTWTYVLNPYIVTMASLVRIETLIQFFYDTEPTALEKIISMMESVRLVEANLVLRTALSLFAHDGMFAASRYERQAGNPVNQLYELNRSIVGRSDIALMFEERSFAVKLARGTGSITAACLLAEPVPRDYSGLSSRATLRSLVSQHLRRKSCVVINGITYTYETLDYDGQHHAGYVANGESYAQIANLFGAPVQQPDGRIIEPEAWAVTERDLVTKYQESQSPMARDELLRLYDLDSSSGNPTRQKAINQLDYSLRTDRFQID